MTEAGFRAPTVCSLVEITYRQLDYWARTGLITPSLQDANGSGSQRLYSFTDLVQLKMIKRLKDAGMSLPKIRSAMETLRTHVGEHRSLADITIVADGSTIYAATSPDEVIDLVRRGQGVFAMAVGPLHAELEAEVDELYPSGDVVHLAPPVAEAT
jgi:DNA-binding transcriptional MerR regulator